MAAVKRIGGMIRDPDSGFRIRNDKSGRNMPKAAQRAAYERWAARREPEPEREAVPF